MSTEKYIVQLTDEEHQKLETVVKKLKFRSKFRVFVDTY